MRKGVNKQLHLDLSECCENITEVVSGLKNVHTLNLSCCDKITDVSMLGNVYKLDLRFCNQILKLIKKIKWLIYHNVQDLYFC